MMLEAVAKGEIAPARHQIFQQIRAENAVHIYG
jgi:ribosome biogenesis GTPase